jgi:hypothetical protein
MPTLLLTHRGEARHVPLAAACLVGRAGGCLARVSDLAVPSYWLELRWAEGSWRWRALAGGERTRGVGMLAEDGWRTLPLTSPARPQRLRLDDVLSVELLEGGPPEAFLLDLQSAEVCAGEELLRIVEVRPDGALLPFSAEGDPSARLQDGDVLVWEGRPWQVHLSEGPEPTARVRIDLARPGVSVDVDPEALRATFHQGEVDLPVEGEHVRVLLAYALARKAASEGGWLSAEDAWSAWRTLGGNPQSPVDRLGWDRGRCRAHLARAGVGNVQLLFESRRMRGVPQLRLGVSVE